MELTAPHSPAEVVQLSPEELLIANTYLTLGSIETTSSSLDVAPETIVKTLENPLIKAYIDRVFLDWGFNNRFKIRKAMDLVLEKKFQELDESGTGSSKDIAELLELSHKMTMGELDRQIALEKIRSKNSTIKRQVNVQVNEAQPSNYHNLLATLLKNAWNLSLRHPEHPHTKMGQSHYSIANWTVLKAFKGK